MKGLDLPSQGFHQIKTDQDLQNINASKGVEVFDGQKNHNKLIFGVTH